MSFSSLSYETFLKNVFFLSINLCTSREKSLERKHINSKKSFLLHLSFLSFLFLHAIKMENKYLFFIQSNYTINLGIDHMFHYFASNWIASVNERLILGFNVWGSGLCTVLMGQGAYGAPALNWYKPLRDQEPFDCANYCIPLHHC